MPTTLGHCILSRAEGARREAPAPGAFHGFPAVSRRLPPSPPSSGAAAGRARPVRRAGALLAGALFLLAALPAAAQVSAPAITKIVRSSFLPQFGTGDTYYLGDRIFLIVEFDQRVSVRGQPRMALTIGADTRYAVFDQLESQRTSAIFSYTVQASDSDTDGYGIAANALELNGGTIAAQADPSVNAALTHAALADGANFKVDGSTSPQPEILQVSFSGLPESGDGTYIQYESVEVRVDFSRTIAVTGRPRLALTVGSQTRYANLSSLVTSLAAQPFMLFSYTVQASDSDTDGISISANALELNGGTITHDVDTGTSASLTHAAVADSANHKVDASTVLALQAGAPALNVNNPPPGSVLKRCDAATVSVSFRYPVVVTASPTVQLDVGGVMRQASFQALSAEATTMFFYYDVMAADSDTDGISFPANAISLNGGSIVRRDVPALHATITHAARSAYAAFKVDGSMASPNELATAAFAADMPDDGATYSLGEPIYMWAIFEDPVEVSGTPQLALTVGANTRKADFQYVHPSFAYYVLFAYIVQASDTDADGVDIPADALSLNGGTITRRCDSAAPTLTHGAVAGGSARKVNGAAAVVTPEVTGVGFGNRPEDGAAYDRGETIIAIAFFSRAVSVSGAPQLGLTIGANTRQARFQRLTRGGLRAVFAYTVAADSDTNGISIPANAISLNGGTITLKGDSSNTAAVLTHAAVSDDYFRQVRVTPITLTLSAAPNPVDEGSSVTVTAELSAALSSNIDIPLTLTAGTAEEGDFGALTSITISSGSTTGTGTITTAQDADTDDETFTVALGATLPSNVAAGAPNSVTVRITDDDGGGVGGGGGGGGGLLFPPRMPASLAARPGDRSVRLEWSPPENDGGSPIWRYEYRLKEGRGEVGEWTPIPDSAVEEVNAAGFTVGDLLNGTVYVFELRAVNAAGNGQESESVEVTMPLDPAYWSNFRAEDLEGTQLMLEAFLLEGSSRDRELRFGEGLRFEQDELDGEGEVTATHSGGYGYRYTSRTTGELSLEFDGGEACQLRLTFSGEGAGSYSYRCGGSSRGQGSFELSKLNRVPEITSTGPFEVEENQTRVGQVEAVDWDEEDEVAGYGIAGGADGALFAIEAETGELRFREAPDYENPGDVESIEPPSEAGDNEYIVVVEVTSGEGERDRVRERAIRVRVSDVEMEEAVEEETESLFVPVILTSAGRGQSFFTSELTLTNRGDEEVRLDYTYMSRDEPERRSGRASDILPAGRQQIRTDALDYLRGLGVPIPETGNQIGTLRVEAPFGSEVRAVVRTTTVVPDGRAGLAYLGVAEEEGFDEPVYLCGLRQNSQDRSNVAFQNMGAAGEGTITLRTMVYSGEAADTSPRELKDVVLEPGGFYQHNAVLNAVGGNASGYVRVERVEGEASFYAYGVINDQVNSDGSFVFPVTASSLEGKMGQTLPVIVETRDFTSELTVTNFSQEPRTLNFQFVAEGIDRDDQTAAFSMTLEAGQQEIVAEVVEALRGEEVAGLGTGRRTLAGPVFVTAEEGDLSGIVVGARTGSKGGGGQYSVFYNAVPEGEGFTREAWVDGLQQNEENRSNLALVNTGEVDGSESIFHLEIYDGETGMLVETVVTKAVPARSWHQINGILGRASSETRQGYIRIEKMSGENPFLAYGVVNDGGAPGQRSGDGAYLPARE